MNSSEVGNCAPSSVKGRHPFTSLTDTFSLMDEDGEPEGVSMNPMPETDNTTILGNNRPAKAKHADIPSPRVHVKFLERSFSEPPKGDNRFNRHRKRNSTGVRMHWPGSIRQRRLSHQLTKQVSRTGERMRHLSERTFTTVAPEDENPERGTWTNQFEFFLSSLGYAVGLGNVWRFPYLCHQNGGGAFLIPYFVALIFCGLPILYLELALGQYASEGPISMWKMAPLFRGIGVGMVIITLVLSCYYNMITGWALYYLYESLSRTLPWNCCDPAWSSVDCVSFARNCTRNDSARSLIDPKHLHVNKTAANRTSANFTFSADDFFHNQVLNISTDIENLGFVQIHLFMCLLLAWLIVFLVLCRGIKSFGKAVYFTSCFPYAVLLILLIRAAMEPGAVTGVKYFLRPQWHRLLDARVWGDAVTQIFFSTSICTGGVITLASYNRFHNDIYRDALVIGLGNSLTSIFSGFVVFSILGFMSHHQDAAVETLVQGGPGLTFIIYPQAVTLLPVSPLWSALFFVMLITLALSSMFPNVENVTTAIIDQFPKQLRPFKFWLTLCVCVVLLLCGTLLTTQGGIYVLLLLDKYAVGFGLVIVGLCEVCVFAWVYGIDRVSRNVEAMTGRRTSTYWLVLWKYVCPTMLAFTLLFTWADFEPLKYQGNQFPSWAEQTGWVLSFVPFCAVVVGALASIAVHMKMQPALGLTDNLDVSFKGRLVAAVVDLLRSDPSWGPALEQNRAHDASDDHDDFDEVFK